MTAIMFFSCFFTETLGKKRKVWYNIGGILELRLRSLFALSIWTMFTASKVTSLTNENNSKNWIACCRRFFFSMGAGRITCDSLWLGCCRPFRAIAAGCVGDFSLERFFANIFRVGASFMALFHSIYCKMLAGSVCQRMLPTKKEHFVGKYPAGAENANNAGFQRSLAEKNMLL